MRFARAPRQADPLLSYANGETPPQIPYSVERWRGGGLEGGRKRGEALATMRQCAKLARRGGRKQGIFNIIK